MENRGMSDVFLVEAEVQVRKDAYRSTTEPSQAKAGKNPGELPGN